MKKENKYQNLHQYLTSKNSISSKKVSLIKSETTSPSSYNERNYSAQNKQYDNKINNKISQFFITKKSNTIDKNCYKNIRLLDNLKEKNNNSFNSFSKELNKNNMNNITKINVKSVPKDKNFSLYNKSLYIQIMKYYTRYSKNKVIKNEEIEFLFKPMTRMINNQKRNIINIKKMKKNLEEISNSKIGKKDNYTKNGIKVKNNKNINQINQLNSNKKKINSIDNKKYIGIDENFNLTFGKSKNWLELSITENNINNNIIKNNNIKSKNNKTTNEKITNSKLNIKNIKNNINIIKNKEIINNNIIENNLESERSNNQLLLISKNEIKNINLNNNNINEEVSTPSFLNENNNEDKKINPKNSTQIKSQKINLPKNIINIENIKLNHHLFQKLIHNKKNILKNTINKLGNRHKENIEKDFNSFWPKFIDKKLFD